MKQFIKKILSFSDNILYNESLFFLTCFFKVTYINEYNEIEITAVRVYLTKTSDRVLVEKLIAEDLPDTQVIVQEE
jgi:hypothetical protein